MAFRNFPIAVVPAYRPGRSLLQLVREIASLGYEKIVVIDDGSGPEFAPVFESLKDIPQCTLLRHAINLGKGRALKTAFNHVLVEHPDATGVVTIDADGQHLPEDVVSVSRALRQDANFVLGTRDFGKSVPLRSRMGNLLTKYIFWLVVGKKLSDTQTGLRAMHISTLPHLLDIGGERYEYETNALLVGQKQGFSITEVPIRTVYLDGNKSSHFNPILDSFRIYFLLARFALSSISTAIVDFLFFLLIFEISKNTALALGIGRGVASVFNFTVNKTFVFHHKRDLGLAITKYYLLVLILSLISYLLIGALGRLGIGVIPAKLIAETGLILFSFTIQREFVFSRASAQ